MKKRMLSLLLAAALALSLAACGGYGDAPAPEPPSVPTAEGSPSPTTENSPPPASPLPEEPSPSPEGPAAAELSLPERDYRPWQRGYMDFLTQLRAKEAAVESAYAAMSVAEKETEKGQDLWHDIIDLHSDCCFLYDVDKDGVPELFITYGSFEAALYIVCYTFRDGETVPLGDFPSRNCGLYTYPGKNAFLLYSGAAGYYGPGLYEFSMEDGALTEGQPLLTGEDALNIELDEVVPGAEEIAGWRTQMARFDSFGLVDRIPLSLATPLLLPVCNWYDGLPATGSDSERARSAILAVLEDNAPFMGVSGEGYYGDTGRTTWEEYIQPGAAYPFNSQPFYVTQYAWQDMNRDGQEECVVRLISEDENGMFDCDGTVVLSEQDGEVYAYFFRFYGDRFSPYTDGTIRMDSGAITGALAFWKGQCYDYSPLSGQPNENFIRLDETAQPVEWVEVGPTDR